MYSTTFTIGGPIVGDSRRQGDVLGHPLDRRQNLLPHFFLVGPDGQLQLHFVGNDVGPRPPWIEPTVTTAGSSGEFSRLTMVCRARMNSAATTTGSFVVSGADPCPPRPRIVTSSEVALAIAYSGQYPTLPASKLRRIVLRQGVVRLGEPRVQPVGEHRPGAVDGFLGGLSRSA